MRWTDMTAEELRGAKGLLHRSVRQMSANGVFGDPTAASAEKGRRISGAVVEKLKVILTELSGD